MKRWTTTIAVFIILVAALEIAVRRWWNPANGLFYGVLEHQFKTNSEPPNLLFIGSSRVGAAVIPKVFDHRLVDFGRKSWNGGAIGDSLGWHFLGLKKALRQYQGKKPVVVLIETNCGTPHPTRWSDNWWNANSAKLCKNLLEPESLPLIWKSAEPLTTRVGLTVNSLLSQLYLFDYRFRVQTGVQSNIRNLLGLGAAPRRKTHIQTDAKAIEKTKAAVLKDSTTVRKIVHWDDTITHSIVQLVQSHQASVAFFEVPFSPVLHSKFCTNSPKEFNDYLKTHNLSHFKVVYPFPDRAFFDLSHLDPEHASIYSKRLATQLESYFGVPRRSIAEVPPSEK